jgi:hypothetical protein
VSRVQTPGPLALTFFSFRARRYVQLTTRPLTPYRLTTPCASPRVDLKRPSDAAALAVSVITALFGLSVFTVADCAGQGDMAQFNEAQLQRMQLLAGATPEFMNFSHFVLESCLVRALPRAVLPRAL